MALHKSINQRSYDFYLKLSGVTWGIATLLFLEYNKVSLVVLAFAALSLLLMFRLFYLRESALKQNKQLFALEIPRQIMVADWLSQSSMAALLAVVLIRLKLADPISWTEDLLPVDWVLIISLACLLVCRMIYYLQSETERNETTQ